MMQVLDAEGRVAGISRSWAEFPGYTAEDLVGRDWRGILTKDARCLFRETVEAALLATGESHGADLEVVSKSGAVLPVSLAARATRSGRSTTGSPPSRPG
jgi:PAS domain S-box-containing protein